jgi:hypothetical protein
LTTQKWFLGLYVFSYHLKDISSHQLAGDISITQKSAWFLLQRLRYAFEHNNFKKELSHIVEVDETSMNIEIKNKHFKKNDGLKEIRETEKGQKKTLDSIGLVQTLKTETFTELKDFKKKNSGTSYFDKQLKGLLSVPPPSKDK